MELNMNANLIKTEAEINALGGKDIVELYNDLAEALGQEPVRRFADKATAVKRTLKLVAQYAVKFPPKAPEAPAKAEKAPKAPKAPKTDKAPSRRRGTNLEPLGHKPEPCREGTKQAALLDAIRNPRGATMAELLKALSFGNRPWVEATVRSGFGWDLKNKGYCVRSVFDADGTERFFLVLPTKFPEIPAHLPRKSAAAPKTDPRQQALAI